MDIRRHGTNFNMESTARRRTDNAPSTASANLSGASTTQTLSSRRQPYLPTTLEAILLATYPIVLVTGSIFSLVDPATRASHYSASAQAHVGEPIPSYFARKSNIFNQIFVKRGWAWVTVSYLYFLLTHPSTGPPGSPVVTPKRLKGLLRWAIVTSWWIFVTQWFFGPALIDRGFTLTGGACEILRQEDKGNIELSDTQRYVTGVACKAHGGKWKGGHDISGHVFLLVLGSMFLLVEVFHVVLAGASAKEERTITMNDGATKSAEVEASMTVEAGLESQKRWDFGVKFAVGVAGLSIWMLLMTAAYFHTWFEKVRLFLFSRREHTNHVSSSQDFLLLIRPSSASTYYQGLFQHFETSLECQVCSRGGNCGMNMLRGQTGNCILVAQVQDRKQTVACTKVFAA